MGIIGARIGADGVGHCLPPKSAHILFAEVLREALTSLDRDEVEMIRALGRRDSGAAEELYKLYSPGVFRFIYRRARENAEDAEDITLETFLSAIDLAKTFDGRSSVFAWLCGIAKLRMIDHHRKKTRAKRGSPELSLEVVEHDAAIASNRWIDQISASQTLDEALKHLTGDEREAILLQFVEGFSVREIAVLLKRSEAATESLLQRAKVKLKAALIELLKEVVEND